MRKHIAKALLVCAVNAVYVHAEGISISFHGGDNQNPANGAAVTASDFAGAFYYNLGNWNNAPDVTGAPNPYPGLADSSQTPTGGVFNLKNNFGAATTAGVSWISNNSWDINNARDNGNRRMMQGYLDTSDTSTSSVFVTGVPYSNYEVVVYFDGDNGGTSRVGKYTMNTPAGSPQTIYGRDGGGVNFAGTQTFLQAYSATDPGAPNPPNDPNLHNQVPGGNYIVFRNMNGADFQLDATGGSTSAAAGPGPSPVGAPRAPINAIQIVETVPNMVFFGANGQGGFNAYEVRLDQTTQAGAINLAPTLNFPGSGVYGVAASATAGHAVTIHSAAENEFVRSRLISNAWIGLSDSSTYGGNDNFTTVTNTSGNPLPAAGVAPVTGERGFGFVWGRGPGVAPTEQFTYQNWNGGEPNDATANVGEDAVELIAASGLWNDNRNGEGPQTGQTRIWVVEYDLNFPSLPTVAPMPTPAGGAIVDGRGKWSVHTAKGYTGGNGQLGHTQQADAFVRSGMGTRSDSLQDVINLADPTSANVGRFGNNVTFDQDTPADDNDFAVVAKARIEVRPDQAGLWTFGVDSDDGFRLRLPGNTFTSTTSIGTLGTHIQGDTMEMPYPRGGATALSLGVVNLAAGVHEVELLFFERAGGGGVELMAAPGAQTQFATLAGSQVGAFQLVGAKGTGATRTIEAVGEIVGGMFNVREVRRNPGGSGNLNNTGEAAVLLNTPDGDDTVATYQTQFVNVGDLDNSGFGLFQGDTRFATDLPGDTNDIAYRATGVLRILTARDITLGFHGDDGGRLRVLDPDGTGPMPTPTFLEFTRLGDTTAAHSVGITTTADVGTDLFYDSNTGNSRLIGRIHLEPGDYPIEYTFWERSGGAFTELFGAVGFKTTFDDTFMLLGASTVTLVDSDGLQLVVPEPSSIGLIALGAAGLLGRRRRSM